MDLQTYLRVVWRFRLIVACGFVLALGLAVLSAVKVDFSGSPTFSYRESETWQSDSTLLITQRGFPEGRSVFPTAIPEDAERFVPEFGDPARFSQLAVVYAELANGDAVHELIQQHGPLNGAIQATPVSAPADARAILPLIRISGTASSPREATVVAERGTEAFQTFLSQQQKSAGIPSEERIYVEMVSEPQAATLIAGPSKTLPAVVFLSVLIAGIGLAFVLENLRPRVAAVRHPESRAGSASMQRSA